MRADDVVWDGNVRFERRRRWCCVERRRELTAIAEGGAQRTVWPANDAAMLLTGPAEIVCRGEAFRMRMRP